MSAFDVYERNHPAGTIALGHNEGRAMYIVFIAPQNPADDLVVSQPDLAAARGAYAFGTYQMAKSPIGTAMARSPTLRWKHSFSTA